MGFDGLEAIIFDCNEVLVYDLKIHEEPHWRAGKELGISVRRYPVRKPLSYSPEKKESSAMAISLMRLGNRLGGSRRDSISTYRRKWKAQTLP